MTLDINLKIRRSWKRLIFTPISHYYKLKIVLGRREGQYQINLNLFVISLYTIRAYFPTSPLIPILRSLYVGGWVFRMIASAPFHGITRWKCGKHWIKVFSPRNMRHKYMSKYQLTRRRLKMFFFYGFGYCLGFNQVLLKKSWTN